ncbi:MAG: HTH-type transcriptional activator IlvY [Congregibacter sp.]
MDLKSLKVFLSVCRSMSFTQAASELHMSVSAVSRTIVRLEDDLGETLFDRDRRGMRPTSATRGLQAYAERALTDWAQLKQAMGSAEHLQGDLRVFCSVTATHRLLSPLLGAYREAFPGVNVALQTGDQADGVDKVARGETDVAVVARPAMLPDKLAFERLTRSSLMLCLPRMDCRITQSLADLDAAYIEYALGDMPWILPDRGVSAEAIDRWLRLRYESFPEVYARVAGHEAIVAMVSLGLGVAIVPKLVIDASGVGKELQVLSLSTHLAPLAIGLCAKAGRLGDPVIAGLWRVASGELVGQVASQ